MCLGIGKGGSGTHLHAPAGPEQPPKGLLTTEGHALPEGVGVCARVQAGDLAHNTAHSRAQHSTQQGTAARDAVSRHILYTSECQDPGWQSGPQHDTDSTQQGAADETTQLSTAQHVLHSTQRGVA
jgi:hypothetical protein